MKYKKPLLLLIMVISIPLFGQSNLMHLRVAPQWSPQSQFAGLYVAAEKGFYREAGFDVEFIHPSYSISSIDLLSQGRVDVITSQLVEILLSVDAGIDLVNFLQTSNNNCLCLFSREPINDVKELNNKTIACWASGFSTLAMAVLSNKGVNAEWVPSTNSLSLFISGATDAILCMTYNELFQLKMSGVKMADNQIINMSDLGYNIPEDGLYTTAEYYAANEENLKKFSEATKRGWDWIRESEANKKEAVELVMEYARLNNMKTSKINQAYMIDKVLEAQLDNNGDTPYSMDKLLFGYAVKVLLNNNFILDRISYGQVVR